VQRRNGKRWNFAFAALGHRHQPQKITQGSSTLKT
jgi:hypothetical protein